MRSGKQPQTTLGRYEKYVPRTRYRAERRGSPAPSGDLQRELFFPWGVQIIPIKKRQYISRWYEPENHNISTSKKLQKKWKKIKKCTKFRLELLTVFRQKYIFLFTVATLSCDSRTKQKVLWQIREGNNWLNNFYMFFISTNKNIPASFSS